MKINNKGFMLVEVIVTSTVIVTAMIGLYTSFNRIYNNYRLKNSYYNIDGVYATKNIVNLMIRSGEINKFINEVFFENKSNYLVDNGECGDILIDTACNSVCDLYEVNNMIFVEYDKVALDDLKNGKVEEQTFKDYIDYVINYYGIESASDSNNREYSYIILTELKDGEDYYYSNLRMR